MKILDNETKVTEYEEQFKDILKYVYLYDTWDTNVARAIRWFRCATISNDSDREKRLSYRTFERICNRIKIPVDEFDIIGDLNIFTEYCIRLIKYDWMTKDEVLEKIKPWPYTDTLVEIIRYDKPLCVNRWEI